jgi:hypothetical protein
MKALLAATGLVAVSLAASASTGGHRTAAAVSSSRLVLRGTVRITVTIDSPVETGHALHVTYRVRNVSKQPRKIQLGYSNLWFVVHAADGTRYDTRVPLRDVIWPYIRPVELRPGETLTRSAPYLRVRWSGPLRITPGWARKPLPALRVAVQTPPGPLPSGPAAVATVVASTGHLLDNCRPQAPGVAVVGRIDAPRHSAPPIQARCSISLQRERGFLVAQVLIAVPPGYQGVHLRTPYERFTWPKSGQNAEAIGWEFVVTRDGATSVDSTSVESTKPGSPMAPDWQWTTTGWQGQPGGSRCGGTGGGGGGSAGPLVEFVSVCPS